MSAPTPTVLQVLEQARKRIRQGWTQDDPARDKGLNPVDANSKRAVCWCLSGAVRRAIFDLTGNRLILKNRSAPENRAVEHLWSETRLALVSHIPHDQRQGMLVYLANDAHDTTKRRVLSWLKKAIKAQTA